jgi:hypothetical protein
MMQISVSSGQICKVLTTVFDQNKDLFHLRYSRTPGCCGEDESSVGHDIPSGSHLGKANEDGLPSYLESMKVSHFQSASSPEIDTVNYNLGNR